MLNVLRAVAIIIAVVVTACGQTPKEDPRVAELEKELAAVKKDLGAGQQATAGAAERQAATSQAPGQVRTAPQTATSVTAKQDGESARLRRELEAMKPREFTLPAGTIVPVRTTAELSTSKLKDGSVFETVLEKDLIADGTTLAKAGALVTCVVVSADEGGRVKGTASLSVAARSIAGVGSNPIAIKTESFTVDADSTKGRDAKRTGIATAIGAGIGAIAGGGSGAAIGAGAGAAAGVGANMATRGKAAVIPTETLIEFALSAPATVVMRK
ncbi:MAG: hypothetical protein ACRD1W_10930 [Vicinamibacterales bacterium]